MNRQELQKAFDEKLIDEATYKQKLFELATKKKEKKHRRHYDSVTETEFLKIISKIKSKKVLIAHYLAYGSGLRLEEILNLQNDDVDLDRKIITIRQGKGDKDRKTNSPKGFKRDWKALIPLKITKMAVQKAFLKASLKAEINRVLYVAKTKAGKSINRYRLHFHCLRHSYATRALENGVPINQVQILLGHANVATTSFYVKANPMDAINSIIDKGV